jgi:RNA polymerase sigma factor (sigma-70 family)
MSEMDAMAPVTDFMSDDVRSRAGRIISQAGQQLRRFIRPRVSSDADAEDVLQDVWQRLVTALEDGPVEQIWAWLYTVARNRITDQYRRPQMTSLDELAAEIGLDEGELGLTDFLLREDKTPETEYLRKLFWKQLHAALAELPKEQREVYVWHELEGLSFDEIAKCTGENLNTLLSRKRYAVQHLRQKFGRLREEFFE